MTIVVKRDGKREAFDEQKVRRAIEAAARDARMPPENVGGLSEEASGNIIDYVRKEKEIRSSTIREGVLNRLDTSAPQVSRAWRDFDRRNKGLC